MYHRKASLDQRPIIMIRMECVPISSTKMWRVSSPIALTASHNAFLICVEVMCSILSYLQTAEIEVSWLAPG